jgi:glutamate dehydrogenase
MMTKVKQENSMFARIAAEVKKQVSPELRKAAETFAYLYYANVPAEDLKDIPLDELVTSVLEMWTFSQTRVPGKAKIRVFTEKRKEDTKLLPQTIVEIVNDDMPFLVDSVTGVINSLGYSINLVIHPVMQVDRDKTHALTNVSDRSSQKPEEAYESFIHCDILDFLSADKRSVLIKNLNHALEDVRVAVEDWGPMKKRLQQAIENLKQYPPPLPAAQVKEYIAFCEWVADNHFTFLGFCEYSLTLEKKGKKQELTSMGGLGILKHPSDQEISKLFGGIELTPTNQRYIVESTPLILTKTTQKSDVHRQDPMDSISVKRFDKNGNVIGLYQFIGLFTSVAYRQSVRDIPLLRQKVSYVLERSGFAEEWHDGKTLIHILESFPREELFQASEDWLFETTMAILQLQNRQRLTLFIRPDKFERFVSCIIYIPRERYDSALRRKFAGILEKNFHAKLTSWQVQLGELAFARVHYTLSLIEKKSLIFDHAAIEKEIREAALTWEEDLQQALLMSVGEKEGLFLFEKYGHGFSKGYQEQISVEDAVIDIIEIEKAFSKNHLHAYASQEDYKDNNSLQLKIYSVSAPVSLSSILPILENMSLNVLSEIPFIISRNDDQKIWIHNFEMQTKEKDPIEFGPIKENFLEGIENLLKGEVENDGFNRLIIRANFSWRECQLFRAYAKYLRQLQGTFSQAYMEETLAKYPFMAQLMYQLFTCQFSPLYKQDRNKEREEILNKIKELLRTVQILDEDRILRKFINVISSTLRTNFYQLLDGAPKSYVSFKINCEAIEEMPLPRPKYEVFVYSSRVEAIHLRGEKIARGGIRWSNRREDFRTETLGLMKAQMVKNAVIIPSGSKGGFTIKQSSPSGLTKEEGIKAYQTMIRGLLDITDNLKGETIVPPPQVVCRDKDDPYLVVAADKGTATFSDYANQIAADYDFWLGDAFASGGETGYDHKKMGITSRGVWESVKRHFREMDQDVTKEEVTVVGIGDMSGDVFGNGVLLSRHFKLLAAFNHLHIFIDPSPNPEKSYGERKRLFTLPSSTWADYDASLISPGGGVFERNAKSISLSPQMKALFEIQEDQLSPPELIRFLLKASVDLMWFGGIGTYIKAKNETSLDVGDPVNDILRVNGADIRAKVIAEGANLGITQLGRIEYAKKGGRLNTDAIDNSAGVDCSDHEVNIKILLHHVMATNGLTLKKRNLLLQNMTDDVARLVLKDNFWQVQAISLARSQGFRLLDEQARLMRDLEEEGLLNRALEYLPDETELVRRMADKQGLTRPELSVLLAYSKISLKKQLIHSNIPDLSLLREKLLSYFPERLQNAYTEEIETHPLRREITTTLITSSIINHMGITFIHEMKRLANVDAPAVVKAYFVVRNLLELSSLWQGIESLETLSTSFQTDLMLRVYETVKRFTEWFLRFGEHLEDIEGHLQKFKPDFDNLKEVLLTLFPAQQKKDFEEKCREYEHQGLPAALATRLLILEPLVAAPDMISLSKELSVDAKLVAKVYFALGQQLGFEWLRKATLALSGDTHWQQGAANAFIEELYMNQRILTKKVLVRGKSVESLFKKDGTLMAGLISTAAVESTLFDLMNASTIDFAMLTVINRQLRMIC